jgi:recombination protein RecA
MELNKLATGIASIDQICGGLPRGALTELSGPRSSGRTTVLYSALAQVTSAGGVGALIDAGDVFDPLSARSAGVELNRLLWARCSGKLDSALKIADMLLQGGGFGIIALDLGDLAPALVRRIPAMYWFRFRRAVENSPPVFLVLSPIHVSGSAASLALDAEPGIPRWSGSAQASTLAGLEFRMSFGRLRGRPGSGTTEKVCLHASMDPRLRKIS